MTATCYSTTATPFHGEVALSYWQTLARVAEREGVPQAKIDRTLKSTAHTSAISVGQYLTLMRLGARQRDDFGLQVGRSITPGSYPVLGMTLLSCQNLRQVLEQVVRYESLNHDLGTSCLDIGANESRYVWTPNPLYLPDSKDEISFHLVVSVFAGIRTFAPWLINQHIPIKQICFTASEPKNLFLYRSFFDTDILYNQPNNSILVKSDVADWPVLNGDTASFSALTAYADTLLNSRESQQDLVWKLKTILPEALRRQTYRIEDVSNQLNMSVRTLQRKLKESGCGYKQILDEVRKQLAEFYLTESSISMSEIAFLVGYQEQSSFNHAFKSWSGLSPSAYRDSQHK
ncbi:AraC family transcriptional regulator [Alkalimarinus coralli]|uniref:AraC family transcriptional regulator n=1 Tax=Alkalimarinus coralli TaxID=2935863 RepID=UPI00202AE50B|nr:AraC family transcriptional regulator [Alkalimarinus coralli]